MRLLSTILNAQEHVNRLVLGKKHTVNLAFTCLIADGHLLIEDQPGVGKTLLATSLAHCLGLQTTRVQFASDVMPSDITGTQIYKKDTEQFEFRPGPVFTQVLLADEVNRAPSKTQSALLQAMEERAVSVDGTNYALPSPFFVLATQNPFSQIGTFALPESQLDRFLMCISLGLPSPDSERQLLLGQSPRQLLASLQPVASFKLVLAAQAEAKQVTVSDATLDYVQALLAATRSHPDIVQGLSTRGAIALMSAAKAYAWLSGRSFVLVDDVQAVWQAVAAHRLVLKASHLTSKSAQLLCKEVLKNTPIA